MPTMDIAEAKFKRHQILSTTAVYVTEEKKKERTNKSELLLNTW